MSQYEYRQRWRKITAEVNILAESSGNSNDETELSFVEHSDPVDQVSIDSVLSSTEKVSSSSDSELDLVDLNEECIGAVAGIDNDGVSSISEELASWATKNNCRRDAVNELLKILRRHGHDSLPKDARTLLQTPRQVLAVNKCGGQYIYLGIAKGIMNVLSSNPSFCAESTNIELVVNIDGLPLFKSSCIEMWPIQCTVVSIVLVSLLLLYFVESLNQNLLMNILKILSKN